MELVEFSSAAKISRHKPHCLSYRLGLPRHMQAESPHLMRKIRANGLLLGMVLNSSLCYSLEYSQMYERGIAASRIILNAYQFFHLCLPGLQMNKGFIKYQVP